MMLHKSGVTQSLARFIAATRWDDVPAPVRHQAKRSLMNFFAVALGSDVNPMSDSDIEAKLRSAATGWDPRYDIAPLVEAIWALDRSADVSRLASLAVPLT